MARYVALLRGINVGGKNLIGMPALKACFEEGGFEDVVTYIQSGNVVFSSKEKASELPDRIERMLVAAFGHYDASIVLRSRSQMKAIVDRAPKGFGSEPALFRYDVAFLKPRVKAAAAIRDIPVKEGVDRMWAGTGVLYASRLIERATSSRINRIASLPIYKDMTIRNWNTTTKLAQLLEAGG
jgi:uncharacterized protein (DUF1697 family)